MKIKIDTKQLLKEQKKTQKICIELLGKCKYSVAELEKILEGLKNVNETLTKNCSSTIMIETKSCGGSVTNVEVPTITRGQLYQENQQLIVALSKQIEIAKVNKLEFVTDFKFSDEQIVS